MSEQYIKAEIVTPRWTTEKWIGNVLSGFFMTALRTLVVWWFVAAWFPELGFTFWQLVLPVYAARMIFGNNAPHPRQLTK